MDGEDVFGQKIIAQIPATSNTGDSTVGSPHTGQCCTVLNLFTCLCWDLAVLVKIPVHMFNGCVHNWFMLAEIGVQDICCILLSVYDRAYTGSLCWKS